MKRVVEYQRAALGVVWRLGRETFSLAGKDPVGVLRSIGGKLQHLSGYCSFPRSLLVFQCRTSEPTISCL